jgi:hypothetical protein
MIGRRPSLLVAVSLCGALIAGCGSSGSSTTSGSTSTSTPAAASTPASTASTSATTPTSSTSSTGSPSSNLSVAQYAAICKSIIEREPGLSASVKSKVESICNKAASGDLAGARAAAKEVCVEVINASPIPAVAKQKALEGCKAS